MSDDQGKVGLYTRINWTTRLIKWPKKTNVWVGSILHWSIFNFFSRSDYKYFPETIVTEDDNGSATANKIYDN